MKLARIFISGLLLIGAGVCQAVGAEGADTPPRWDVSLRGGLYVNNEQAWLLRPAVGYSFNDYVGVSLGVEFTSQYNQPSRFTQIDGYEAELLRSEKDVGWMVFKLPRRGSARCGELARRQGVIRHCGSAWTRHGAMRFK